MKAKILDEKEFTPVTIELTIETEEEFLNIYSRINLALSTISNGYRNGINDKHTPFDEVLDEIKLRQKL